MDDVRPLGIDGVAPAPGAAGVTLHIRTDASRRVGLGHLMRCIAVAEAAAEQELGVRFWLAGDGLGGPILQRRLLAFAPVGADDDSWLELVRPGDIVVLDSYALGPTHRRQVRARAALGVIDDDGGGVLDVDVLLYPDGSDASRYAVPPGALVLAGPAHALVRAELRTRRRQREGNPGTLVVTLGGADPTGAAAPVLRALGDRWSGLGDVVLLLGPGGSHVQPPPGVAVVRDPDDVGALFDRAEACITAAGTTTWELCAMGVPTAAVAVVDNQVHVPAALAEAGAGLSLGHVSELPITFGPALDALVDPAVRARLSRRALATVDGRGAERFVDGLVRRRLSRRAPS